MSFCDASNQRLQPPFCAGCGDELAVAEAVSGVCRACHANVPAFLDGARSAFRFGGAARAAVHALKYDGVTALAPLLASALAQALLTTSWAISTIVPVPLHHARRRERGYNQAEELGRALGVLRDLPLTTNGLVRERSTRTQTQLGRAARRENVQGAFRWRGPDLGGSRVLLVDDVMTTGATLDACAAALKTGGAGAVYAVTVARD